MAFLVSNIFIFRQTKNADKIAFPEKSKDADKNNAYKARIAEITNNGKRNPTAAEITSVFNDFHEVFGDYDNPDTNLKGIIICILGT